MPFGALTAPNSATRTHSRMSHASERGVAGEPSRIHSRVNRRTLFAGAAALAAAAAVTPAAPATATAVTGVSSASPPRDRTTFSFTVAAMEVGVGANSRRCCNAAKTE